MTWVSKEKRTNPTQVSKRSTIAPCKVFTTENPGSLGQELPCEKEGILHGDVSFRRAEKLSQSLLPALMVRMCRNGSLLKVHMTSRRGHRENVTQNELLVTEWQASTQMDNDTSVKG